ncbi:MAG: polyketide cyclase, partial [Sciscionella sp.]|nr:polyketide cyclase [Sciscionella sp.]
MHMNREALGDLPMGRYDVTVLIERFERDAEIAWSIIGTVKPPIGHIYGYTLASVADGTLVSSYYDWSNISEQWRQAGIFPVISQSSLRATLGILERTVRRGYPQKPTISR